VTPNPHGSAVWRQAPSITNGERLVPLLGIGIGKGFALIERHPIQKRDPPGVIGLEVVNPPCWHNKSGLEWRTNGAWVELTWRKSSS
jgi:hypothetical protein